ncbi:siderophore-interacting protein [Kribbella amoyensis]|uniref:siderophore-interacting protein n=1 Tax=Kribbella amoyensis TaxID=996641 RepID=UPI00119D3195|nr:siderophore-interacting protein [Kribbella amoyensis]
MTAVVMGTVVAVRSLSPSFVTVSLAGCSGLETGGYDQRIKILLARPGQDEPVLPPADNWYGAYREMPDDVRPVMRTFTIRAQQGEVIDVEFALHGDTGPASAWARSAKPGSKLGIVGPEPSDEPKALQYRPDGPDWQLLVADETALPALTSIVENLPAGTDARVVVQVREPGDIREFGTAAELDVVWVVADDLAEAVRKVELPAGTPYAWVAGEAGVVREIRRYLTKELGWESAPHYFGGYWKTGQSEG